MDRVDTLLSLFEQQLQRQDLSLARRATLMFLQQLPDLTGEEATLLCQRALSRHPLQGENDSDVLVRLAQVSLLFPGSLTPLHAELIAHRCFSPGCLYLGATETTCQQLCALLDTSLRGLRNDLLIALAWVGDKTVQGRFADFRKCPPAWRSELFIPPEDYSLEAGWELTDDGGRRDLFSSPSFRLVPSWPVPQTANIDSEVLDECCGWCQSPLHRILELDLHDPRYRWVSPAGERISLAICSRCSFYQTVYLDITLDGRLAWSKDNGDASELVRQLPEDSELPLPDPMPIGRARQTPFEAMAYLLSLDETGISSLGGHPAWIGDAVYPRCPSCQQRMTFLGQVDLADWIDGEGVFYLFLCLPCKKAATHYQQS